MVTYAFRVCQVHLLQHADGRWFALCPDALPALEPTHAPPRPPPPPVPPRTAAVSGAAAAGVGVASGAALRDGAWGGVSDVVAWICACCVIDVAAGPRGDLSGNVAGDTRAFETPDASLERAPVAEFLTAVRVRCV